MLIDATDIASANDGHLRSSDWAMSNLTWANTAIDLLRSAAYLPLEELDDVTILRLAVRLINSAGACGSAALDGFYQPAATQIRDIIEVGFLLDLFSRNPTSISRWRDADEDERWKNFTPAKLRKKLDHLDGGGKTYRATAYKFFSEHGTHPNPSAVGLISPGMNTIVGPFSDEQRVIGLSFDLARHLCAAAVFLTKCILPHRLDESEPYSRDYLLKAIALVEAISAFRQRNVTPII
jgi:hypothetical protein